MMLVADPQLVDPHTYPGRPWPLSTLTISYTDLYMRRVFSQSTHALNPQTTIFLGDLFDGGREWSTEKSESPEEVWRKYGKQYWLREYKRFANIFWTPWNDWQKETGEGGHKLLAGLPGNHDLGFAAGVQKPVRMRFNAYFGDGNRVDIIGNHTIVSLDTVSLSALETDAEKSIWKPTEEFLESNVKTRKRAVSRALAFQRGENGFTKYKHKVMNSDELSSSALPAPATGEAELPLVLLTHVPLYREPGTPCGPLRERYPPQEILEGHEPPQEDDKNALPVAYGYQYQTVVSSKITEKIVKALGTIRYVFSGDDHDYCEVTHHGYTSGTGGIKEITVKSLSWAMGVRKPGFLLASLWNPIDSKGQSLNGQQPTMQTQLCLMPDQLGIFIRYGLLFGLTLALLAVRAFGIMMDPSKSTFNRFDTPLLPTRTDDYVNEAQEKKQSATDTSLNSSSAYGDSTNLLTRSSAATRPRTASPGQVYDFSATSGGMHQGRKLPLIAHAGYYGPPERSSSLTPKSKPKMARKPLLGWRLAAAEMLKGMLSVGAVPSMWYWWLLRGG